MPRARDVGIAPGRLPTGARNALVDVAGVRVGHTTVRSGRTVHTGVTAIVPDRLEEAGRLPAGLFVGNGFGKLVGATQLQELGEIETPILLTGTLSAFRVADALVTHVINLPGNERVMSLNPVVGETNDGFLSDIRDRPISEAHVLAAIEGARRDNVEEGCVGAGTGTCALGYKAGIGTSSRVVPLAESDCTVGVLVQSNFSGRLQVLGTPVPGPDDSEQPQGNSCMIVVAVDRGLDARQLRRLATRAVFAMGRVGSEFAQGSGDYGIAFATAAPEAIADSALDPAFFAVQEAVEEALLNSLFMAETTHGVDGHVRYAVDAGRVAEMLQGVAPDGAGG